MNDEVISKIKKLLTVADTGKGSTQAEAETALVTAQRLALKHGIDLASIDMTEDTAKGEPFIQQPFTPERAGGGQCVSRLPSSHKFITSILTGYFGVRVIEVTATALYTDKGEQKVGPVKSLSIIGRQTNVSIAIYVYGFLYREFMDRWADHRRSTNASLSSRNSYFYGLYLGLADKLERDKGKLIFEEEAKLATAAAPQDLSIVLVSEAKKLHQATAGYHPRIRHVTPTVGNIHDYGSMYTGKAEGKEIEIVTALKK